MLCPRSGQREDEEIGHESAELVVRARRTVPLRIVHAEQYRTPTRRGCLEGRSHFAGLPRRYARIVQTRRKQHGRVRSSGPDVMHRTHRQKRAEPGVGSS
jgi:hypothetical protein